VDTLRNARKATMNDVYAAIIIIVVTLALVFLAPEYFGGPDMFWFVIGQAVIYALIGIFIWCNSRIAAILGLALFIADKICADWGGSIQSRQHHHGDRDYIRVSARHTWHVCSPQT
jgi:hypothetical protein